MSNLDNNLTFILRLVAFAVLHSLLAVPRIKERITRYTGLNASAYRLGYNIISLMVFGWVMTAGRNSTILYEIPGLARYAFYLSQALLLVALAFCLKNTGLASFLGLDALKMTSENRMPHTLATKGWYGIVRHPLYLLSILFMFLNPVMTVRWMLLASLGTLYFLIGALIEEKRLQKEFGDTYILYRKQVPFIVPSLRNILSGNSKRTVFTLLLFSIIRIVCYPEHANADLSLPVSGPITSGVGLRIDPFGSGKLIYHRGIDIAVPVGTPVLAVRKGRVVFAGERRGYGGTVMVEHDNGDRTMYGHNSLVRVTSGDLVESGTVVAFSGNTGRSTGPHVHFEQIASGRPITEEGLEKEEAVGAQFTAGNNQRYLLEQRMEESVNSILRTLNISAPSGQGGS